MITIVPDGPEELQLHVSVWRSILRMIRTYDKTVRMVCTGSRLDMAMTEAEILTHVTDQQYAIATASVTIGIPGRWAVGANRAILLVPQGKENVFADRAGNVSVLLYRRDDPQMTAGILIGLRQLMSM